MKSGMDMNRLDLVLHARKVGNGDTAQNA